MKKQQTNSEKVKYLMFKSLEMFFSVVFIAGIISPLFECSLVKRLIISTCLLPFVLLFMKLQQEGWRGVKRALTEFHRM